MEPGFLLQLGNCLLLCWVGTEWMLSGSIPSSGTWGRCSAAGWALVNGFAWLSNLDAFATMHSSRAAFAWATRLVTLPLWVLDKALRKLLGSPGLLSLMATIAIATVAAARSLKSGSSPHQLLRCRKATAGLLLLWGLLWVLLHLCGAEEWAEAALLERILVVAASYYCLCLWDVRRRKPDLGGEEFLAHFVAAGAKALLILPVATVAVAAGFLVLVTLLEAVRLPTAWLNGPIYYGALYGPFSSVYFFAKRQVMSAKLLPL